MYATRKGNGMNRRRESSGTSSVVATATLGGGFLGGLLGVLSGLAAEPTWLFTREDYMVMHGMMGLLVGLVVGALVGLLRRDSR